jgi:hypothetical protein
VANWIPKQEVSNRASLYAFRGKCGQNRQSPRGERGISGYRQRNQKNSGGIPAFPYAESRLIAQISARLSERNRKMALALVKTIKNQDDAEKTGNKTGDSSLAV